MTQADAVVEPFGHTTLRRQRAGALVVMVGSGPWFGWTIVGAASIGVIKAEAGLRLDRLWSAGDRWFARIDTPGRQVSPRCRTATPPSARRE